MNKNERIKFLEDALVEERARGNHYGMSYEEATDGNFERWIIDGEKDLPKFYLDRVRTEAKRQLQAEGKIGPDAKPREGLYGKYRVEKADGSPVDPNADYFILRLDADPVAWSAAREYARMTPNRKLSNDLLARVAKYDPCDGIREPDEPRSPQESDDLKHCHSCGKSIEEVKGNLCKGDYFIGSIFLDPGQEASRFDPPIDASYYFSCCDCARSWQITEERRAALSAMSSLRTDVDCPQCDAWLHFSDIAEHAPVLCAMLEEAE
jgi:hypothetical protein